MTDQTGNQSWLERLRKVVPYGTSTCSKAAHFLPEEPAVIVRGRGCRVWDAEGREFIDYRNGLGPVTLGYQYPAVDAAIRGQLEQGIVFGHPHPLEAEVAEQICAVIPCAERARFLKTGGEAVAACIRLARHYTGRDHVVQIGYNGWLNSLAAGGRALPGQVSKSVPPGVPAALSALHHAAAWNNFPRLESLFAEYDRQIAALIIAADYAHMPEGKTFYPLVRELTRRHGTVLIYDEIVTGFRIATGGVQEYFGVKPDLAVFAKGVANGMPLSVYCGRADIMDLCKTVIISSTYGGEALALAAAKATLDVYKTGQVVPHLWRQGETLATGLNRLFQQAGIPAALKGLWPCAKLGWAPETPDGLPERFVRAAYRHGVSLYHVVYPTFSHQDADIAETLTRLEQCLKTL